MKRAKIMLTSIAVLAVVGGALAFKANNKFQNTYCILTTLNKPSGGTCTDQIANSKFFVQGGTNQVTYWYVTKPAVGNCNQQSCVTSTSFIAD